MVRLILSFILTAALTGSAAAQSTWYVDPTSGNNGNTGSSPGDAFLSITHALGSNPLLASGDTIVLNGGVYNSADGLDASGNQSEVFPLELPNGVSLVSGDLFSDPVIDGENVGVNAGALIDVAESIDSVTEVRGITFENCISPFVSATVNSIRGLLVDSCIFRGYDGAGILLQLS
ncbi:MAG: DUF1565 domain-containing protein, partial [Planctomycetes bacterium]|nr:DUF1565 domain-containing protein [Planctomycetota bacterium]